MKVLKSFADAHSAVQWLSQNRIEDASIELTGTLKSMGYGVVPSGNYHVILKSNDYGPSTPVAARVVGKDEYAMYPDEERAPKTYDRFETAERMAGESEKRNSGRNRGNVTLDQTSDTDIADPVWDQSDFSEDTKGYIEELKRSRKEGSPGDMDDPDSIAKLSSAITKAILKALDMPSTDSLLDPPAEFNNDYEQQVFEQYSGAGDSVPVDEDTHPAVSAMHHAHEMSKLHDDYGHQDDLQDVVLGGQEESHNALSQRLEDTHGVDKQNTRDFSSQLSRVYNDENLKEVKDKHFKNPDDISKPENVRNYISDVFDDDEIPFSF